MINHVQHLRQGQAQTYNLVIPEEGIDIRFRLTPLEDHEASDYRSTTMIDQRLLGSQPPNLAVIMKATKNGDILTCSRFSNSRDLAGLNLTWHYSLIPSYGDQNVSLATAGSRPRSTQALDAPPELARKSIAEWVAAIPSRGDDPSKPPDPTKESIENSPLAAHHDPTEKPKRRFGRNRKMPALENITEIKDTTFDYTKDDGHINPPACIDPPAKLAASTSSTSKSPSHSVSQSPQADVFSSTPSTQNSTTPNDLLMSEEVALAYPVMIPIPATNCQDTESRTSQASPPPPPPTWVGRKVTSSAENQRPGLLVNSIDTEHPIKQPVSYLAVAKRGTSTVGIRGSSRGRASTRGGRSNQPQPHAGSPDRAQTNWTAPEATRKASEPKSKATVPTHPTVGQTVQPQKSSAAQRVNNDPSRPDSSTVIQLLQVAKGLGGILKMEVEIGRILVKTDRIQPTNVYNAWSSIFGLGTETIFTNRWVAHRPPIK